MRSFKNLKYHLEFSFYQRSPTFAGIVLAARHEFYFESFRKNNFQRKTFLCKSAFFGNLQKFSQSCTKLYSEDFFERLEALLSPFLPCFSSLSLQSEEKPSESLLASQSAENAAVIILEAKKFPKTSAWAFVAINHFPSFYYFSRIPSVVTVVVFYVHILLYNW